MNKRKIMLTVGLLLMVSFTVFAGGKRRYGRRFEAEDTSAALRVYNGFNEDLTIKVTGDSGAITCAVGTVTTTLDISGASIDDVAELAAAMLTVSNSANRTLLKTDTDCVIATTEAIDDELVATTLTIKAGRWGNAVNWTSTDVSHFDVYMPGGNNGGPGDTRLVEKIMGTIGGTGNVACVAYIDGSQVWESVIVSPIYVLGAISANTTTSEQVVADEISAGVLNIPFDLGLNPTENLLLRFTRGTSVSYGGATTVLRYGTD